MTKYSLYLGNKIGDRIPKNLEKRLAKCRDRIAQSLPGFTESQGVGYWQGQQEPTTIYTILTEKPQDQVINTIVQDFKQLMAQESVLWTRETIKAVFA